MKKVIKLGSSIKIIKKKPKKIPNDNLCISFLENITNEVNKNDEDKQLTRAILNWLSRFFNKMEGSSIALTLLGNEELSVNMFWNKIIQPIFGTHYSITIDDNILKNDVDKILSNKIFYNIGDFSPTEQNIDKVNKILQAVLIEKSILINKTEPKHIPVYGQIIITSKNIIPHIKSYHSQLEYINIEDTEQTIKNLKATSIPNLQLKFTDKELESFADILYSFYKKEDDILTVVNSIENLTNYKEVKNINIDQQINEFVQAFKSQNIDYFDKVKEIEDSKLYEELKDALLKEDGFYIKQDLSKYYNVIYDQSFKNDELMNILQTKDDMFKQQIDKLDIINKNEDVKDLFSAISTSGFITRKKLSRIKNFTLPSKITVPKDFIIRQVSKKNRFEYDYEDTENAKNLYEYFDKKQAREKEKK